MTCTVLLLAAGLAVTALLSRAPHPADGREALPAMYVATTAARRSPVTAPVTVPAAPRWRSSRTSVRRSDLPVQVSQEWVSTLSARTGIPPEALTAYGRATLVVGREQPGCRLGWNTLAGIGYVESEHGTVGGRRLLPDGRSSLRVLGPALDGSRFAAVPSTSRSVMWHGDPRWDHAVGPMQFLPTTWRRWAADGDLDGVRDPNDIDDAAYASARYLCAAGGDLATGPAWQAAVLSYNHSTAYVAAVLAAADTYARLATT